MNPHFIKESFFFDNFVFFLFNEKFRQIKYSKHLTPDRKSVV